MLLYYKYCSGRKDYEAANARVLLYSAHHFTSTLKNICGGIYAELKPVHCRRKAISAPSSRIGGIFHVFPLLLHFPATNDHMYGVGHDDGWFSVDVSLYFNLSSFVVTRSRNTLYVM